VGAVLVLIKAVSVLTLQEPPLTRGGRPHNLPPARSLRTICSAVGRISGWG
jgi:hypothetical protein